MSLNSGESGVELENMKDRFNKISDEMHKKLEILLKWSIAEDLTEISDDDRERFSAYSL